MKELILWREVDVKDELPTEGWVNVINYGNVLYKSNQFYFIDGEGEKLKFSPTHWLKRVVIPILSDQEIEKKMDELGDTIDFDKSEMYPINAHYIKICTALYKAMQERLMANEK